MTTTTQPRALAWAAGVRQVAEDFAPTPLTLLAGGVPSGLRGTLYRNGPGRLQRGGQTVGHWFDGDGGILAVRFAAGSAIAQYRYVQTAGYQQEEAAGKYLLAGYGMVPPVPWWQRFGRDLKNVANTSVLALPDKLLALWEGGLPHALDQETLATWGTDDLGGLADRPYSAHPKRDPQTGDIFNFGVTFGVRGVLHLYRSDRTGQIQQQNQIPLRNLPPIHDCVLAGRYLVFCISPVRLQVWPVMARLQSYSEALTWHPDQPTEILVVDRDRLELVCRLEAEPWYQWHFGNGCELPDGSIQLAIARYPDFQTNQRLREVATGEVHTLAAAHLWQLRLDPDKRQVLSLEPVLERSCEFPVTAPQEVGQPWRYSYLNVHSQAADVTHELFDAIARFDHDTGELVEADCGPAHYPTEPIYAPDAHDPSRGWVLTVVYRGDRQASEVWIYAAEQLALGPVCRLALPHVIPPGFHGTWQPA